MGLLAWGKKSALLRGIGGDGFAYQAAFRLLTVRFVEPQQTSPYSLSAVF